MLIEPSQVLSGDLLLSPEHGNFGRAASGSRLAVVVQSGAPGQRWNSYANISALAKWEILVRHFCRMPACDSSFDKNQIPNKQCLVEKTMVVEGKPGSTKLKKVDAKRVSISYLAPRLLLAVLLACNVLGGQTPVQQNLADASKGDMKPGVVVEKIAHHGEAEKAGLREGDILLGWSRGDSKGEIQSPFDLETIETEEEPLGKVTLDGRRGTQKLTWLMGYEPWQVEVRPNFSSAFLAAYREGQDLAKNGKVAEASECWRKLADRYAGSPVSWLRAWLLLNTAELLRKAEQWNAGDETYAAAVQAASKTDPGIAAQILEYWATAYDDRNDLSNVEKYLLQSIAASKNSDRHQLANAERLNRLGTAWIFLGDFSKAGEFYHQALDLREKLAPGSLAVASSLNNLGNLYAQQGDFAKTDTYYREALQIREKLVPGSLRVAASLNNLGILARRRGDLAKAEEYDRRALEIFGTVLPGGMGVAVSLGNLGNVASDRGDLAKAEECYRQALDIKKRLVPGSLDMAVSLSNLAGLANDRGEPAKAAAYYRQALEIQEKVAPEGLGRAISLNDLGDVSQHLRNFAKAEEYYLQALAIERKVASESLDTAYTLQGLGGVARNSGDPAKAEHFYRQALAIREKLAPGSVAHAESLAAVASAVRDQQQLDIAAQFYAQAVSALESQTTRLGGSEQVRSVFRANHADIYRDYVALLLVQKRTELAFQVLERSRARILLEMLLAAHIDVRKGADPSLLEQERSLKELLAAKSDRRLRLLEEKNNEKQSALFTKEIEDLEKQYQEVEELIKLNSPIYAALTQPQFLTAGEIQHLLDHDTLLLEFSLGGERSYVFAVTSDSLTVDELPKRAEIESQAKVVYELLTARNHWVQNESAEARQRRIAKSDADYRQAASALSQILLGPAVAELRSKRLLIVGDGALQYLPFAALPVPRGPRQSTLEKPYVPLIMEHEIVQLPSASVLAVLRKERGTRSRPSKHVLVMADPVFDSADIRVKHPSGGHSAQAATNTNRVSSDSATLLTRSLADLDLSREGPLHLPRLPFTRREAAGIIASAPAGMAKKAIDFDANRRLALSGELAEYQIVHFATHALMDNQHPEFSGLVLSLVDKNGNPQDGFLGLQDIYNLDLRADLVVLSACETALGKQVDGEGMIGLTRGFMYAGASNVLGTLWSVSDFATDQLMREFYRAMEQERMPMAQSLRQAQLALWNQKHWSAPYYWAAFTLQGDWN